MPVRPVVTARGGAVSAAHPLAVSAGVAALERGGTAADAAVAAQAVLSVVLPDACGLGGDALFLVHAAGASWAVNGTGRSPAGHDAGRHDDGARSVTVPGAAGAWVDVVGRWGRQTIAEVLEPAMRLARSGVVAGRQTIAARDAQRARLRQGNGNSNPWMDVGPGDVVRQPDLADSLAVLGSLGAAGFYEGRVADAITRAVHGDAGWLDRQDLAAHETPVVDPVTVSWGADLVHVQPPMAQGVLLAMVLRWLDRRAEDLATADPVQRAHLAVEASTAAFAHRDRVGDGAALLEVPLDVDEQRASNRIGPRAYLHTAGVAVADDDGMVVSSLASVFDDFGSAVYVPGGGFVLNNRAGGFTRDANAPAPGRRPVHTLAPALLERADGEVVALATPGADGQVQALAQMLLAVRFDHANWATAIAAPRWRSEAGRLMIERSHPLADALRERGHQVEMMPDGDPRAGAVVLAGASADHRTWAGSDWRREVWAGVR